MGCGDVAAQVDVQGRRRTGTVGLRDSAACFVVPGTADQVLGRAVQRTAGRTSL
jgi:hypothetical protein